MTFIIEHKTKYTYSNNVFLEPHVLRFKPATTKFCNIKSFFINVLPEPAGLCEQTDIENNNNHICWFEGMQNELTIQTRAIIEIANYNPFNFIIHPSSFYHLPLQYDDFEVPLLHSALQCEGISETMKQYTKDVIGKYSFETTSFLFNITRLINEDFEVESRYEGPPLDPGKTFDLKTGSCRDLAWMQIQMLRNVGIAARFVSGYLFIEMEEANYELHAWLEAYIPGAGWIGLDPSQGMVTGNNYFAVSQSSDYRNTMPVSGSIRGDADSKMEAQVFIEKIK